MEYIRRSLTFLFKTKLDSAHPSTFPSTSCSVLGSAISWFYPQLFGLHPPDLHLSTWQSWFGHYITRVFLVSRRHSEESALCVRTVPQPLPSIAHAAVLRFKRVFNPGFWHLNSDTMPKAFLVRKAKAHHQAVLVSPAPKPREETVTPPPTQFLEERVSPVPLLPVSPPASPPPSAEACSTASLPPSPTPSLPHSPVHSLTLSPGESNIFSLIFFYLRVQFGVYRHHFYAGDAEDTRISCLC